MAKMNKKFTVDLPVSKKEMKNGKLQQIHVGDVQLFVSAEIHFTEDPDIDFDKILWNGCDILPMLDNMPAADELMQTFTHAAFTYIYDVIMVGLAEQKEKNLEHA